jgi:hypothetical protein
MSSSFQRIVEMAVSGLINAIICIDYILLHSRNHLEHKELLEISFNRLRNAGLKVNLAKCKFEATNVSYSEYRLTTVGILPGSDRLKAVRNSKALSTAQEIRQFMGSKFFLVTSQKFCRNQCTP